jgi:hypothetical protein
LVEGANCFAEEGATRNEACEEAGQAAREEGAGRGGGSTDWAFLGGGSVVSYAQWIEMQARALPIWVEARAVWVEISREMAGRDVPWEWRAKVEKMNVLLAGRPLSLHTTLKFLAAADQMLCAVREL